MATNLGDTVQTITIGGDLTVKRLGFGAMRLCGPGVWGYPKDRDRALAVLRHAVERGVDFIDTSNAYGPDVNEKQIAEALFPYPAGLTIATKGGFTRPGPGRWHPDGRPESIKTACEGSLRRLRVDSIALYQFHTPDDKVPFEESVGVFAELQAAGKIRHVGLSNVSLEQLAAAQRIVPVVSVQNRYNLADRESDPVLAACERQGIAFLPWAPLDAGALGKPRGALARIARERKATPNQIALAWLLRRSPVMTPIPGTSLLAHLDENLAAAQIGLAPGEFEELSGG
ncbi:MAG: aldo/keto reductase [Vulcanimicrobiaceae bacterium]